MKRLFIFFLIFCFPPLTAAAVWAGEPQQFERRLKKNVTQTYLLQTPQGYDPDRKYPLLIAVHKEGGDPLDQGHLWSPLADREQYILLCPKFNEGFPTMESSEDLTLMLILLELQKDFPYDPSKVYMVGLSGGAEFVHRFAFKRPNIVQAVAVFALGTYDPPPRLLRNRQVRFFVGVGENDSYIKDNRVEKAENFYRVLKDSVYDVTFKIYPLVGRELSAEMQEDTIRFFNTLQKSE